MTMAPGHERQRDNSGASNTSGTSALSQVTEASIISDSSERGVRSLQPERGSSTSVNKLCQADSAIAQSTSNRHQLSDLKTLKPVCSFNPDDSDGIIDYTGNDTGNYLHPCYEERPRRQPAPQWDIYQQRTRRATVASIEPGISQPMIHPCYTVSCMEHERRNPSCPCALTTYQCRQAARSVRQQLPRSRYASEGHTYEEIRRQSVETLVNLTRNGESSVTVLREPSDHYYPSSENSTPPHCPIDDGTEDSGYKTVTEQQTSVKEDVPRSDNCLKYTLYKKGFYMLFVANAILIVISVVGLPLLITANAIQEKPKEWRSTAMIHPGDMSLSNCMQCDYLVNVTKTTLAKLEYVSMQGNTCCFRSVADMIALTTKNIRNETRVLQQSFEKALATNSKPYFHGGLDSRTPVLEKQNINILQWNDPDTVKGFNFQNRHDDRSRINVTVTGYYFISSRIEYYVGKISDSPKPFKQTLIKWKSAHTFEYEVLDEVEQTTAKQGQAFLTSRLQILRYFKINDTISLKTSGDFAEITTDKSRLSMFMIEPHIVELG